MGAMMAKYYKAAGNKVKWKKPAVGTAASMARAFQTTVSKPRYGIAVFNTDTAAVTREKLREWYTKGVVGTSQQEVIWDAMQNGTKHLVGRAYAGTGKTFTALEGVSRITKPEEVECSTSHSMMYAVLKEHFPTVRTQKYKVNDLANKLLGIKRDEYVSEKVLQTRDNVVALVGLFKNTMLEMNGPNLFALCDRFTINLEGSEEETYEVTRDVLKLSNEDLSGVDFDDMIYLPVLLGLRPKRPFKFLIVDEAQDYNVAQRLGAMMCAERVMAIGDEFQSLYAFRGADAKSIPNFIQGLEGQGGVDVLPLTMTRRCPKKVVESVKEFVPDYEAMPEAKEGSVEWKEQKEARKMYKPGDMVLCRTNMPLVSEAYAMLRDGKPCQIRGRDFGKTLVRFVKSMKAGTVADLYDAVHSYEQNELTRLRAKAKYRPVDNLIQAVQDKVGCVSVFMEGAATVEAVVKNIENMFVDINPKVRGSYTLLSTIHKAKGDEEKRVFVLERDQMPSKWAKTEEAVQQELNCCYTAHTRTINDLVLVKSPYGKKEVSDAE